MLQKTGDLPLPWTPEHLAPVALGEIILENIVAETERQIAVKLVFALFKIGRSCPTCPTCAS